MPEANRDPPLAEITGTKCKIIHCLPRLYGGERRELIVACPFEVPPEAGRRRVPSRGFEPLIFGSGSRRSIQLNYEGVYNLLAFLRKKSNLSRTFLLLCLCPTKNINFIAIFQKKITIL
jgi:hypothetical protein